MDLIITILPVVTNDLPISPRFTPYNFLSRCKFSTLTTRQPMVEFYLLTFPRFPLRKKEHKSYFGKNRTHDFRTSRCAGLLDHLGDELIGCPGLFRFCSLVFPLLNPFLAMMSSSAGYFHAGFLLSAFFFFSDRVRPDLFWCNFLYLVTTAGFVADQLIM